MTAVSVLASVIRWMMRSASVASGDSLHVLRAPPRSFRAATEALTRVVADVPMGCILGRAITAVQASIHQARLDIPFAGTRRSFCHRPLQRSH